MSVEDGEAVDDHGARSGTLAMMIQVGLQSYARAHNKSFSLVDQIFLLADTDNDEYNPSSQTEKR
jgi:hypothetical protein